jgi:magnesium-transporting ATPase (P-type)
MNDVEKIREAVREEIRVTVNGKIDGIKAHLIKQDERADVMERKMDVMGEKIDDLKPLSEFQKGINSLRKFILWIAAPASIIYGLYQWVM